MTTSEVNLAKTGPIRSFLDKYVESEPSTLADCAAGTKLDEFLPGVGSALVITYHDLVRSELEESLDGSDLGCAFIDEMDNLIRAMGLQD